MLGDGKKHRMVYQLDDPGVEKTRFALVVRVMELQEQGYSHIRP